MSIPFVEAHTHLDHYDEAELADVLASYGELPCVSWAVTIDLESWAEAQKRAVNRPEILPTFGIHPWEAHRYHDRLDELDEPIAVSAHLGEIGLDFVWVKEEERWPWQIEIFDYFLVRAAAQNKIVNLHTKGAEQLTADKLRQFKVERALVHWYSGPIDAFDDLVSLGCYFSFGIELPHSEHIQALARRCPRDRILTETDGPGAQEWLTGERASPRQIPSFVTLLAELHGVDAAEMKGQVWENYQHMMGN